MTLSSVIVKLHSVFSDSQGCHGDGYDSPATPGTTLSCPPDDSLSSPNSRFASLDTDVEPELLVH